MSNIINCPTNIHDFQKLLTTSNYTKYLVTPEAATMILDNFNTANRDFKPSHREFFKNIISKGEFIENSGNTIKFDKQGMKDGQHRLGGQIDANATLTHLFVFNIDDSAMSIIDIGKNRKLYDKISILAKEHNRPNLKMSPVEEKALISFINGTNPNKIRNLSLKEIYNLWSKEQYRNAINFAIKCFNSKQHRGLGLGTAGQIGIIARAMFTGVDTNKLESFCLKLRSGAGIAGDPVYALYKKLIESRRKVNNNGGRLSEVEKYKYTELCLNAYLNNESIRKLHIGSFADIFNVSPFIDNDKNVC